MELAEGIRRIGFRRWYERQLIESHLYLVTCFLCLVMVLACYEGFSLRMPAWETLLRLVAMLAGSAACVWTLRRYLAMLNRAVRAAERSVCGKCGAYSALELKGSGTPGMISDARRESDAPPVEVRCRKCGHEWAIG